jgi:hypothetical protein
MQDELSPELAGDIGVGPSRSDGSCNQADLETHVVEGSGLHAIERGRTKHTRQEVTATFSQLEELMTFQMMRDDVEANDGVCIGSKGTVDGNAIHSLDIPSTSASSTQGTAAGAAMPQGQPRKGATQRFFFITGDESEEEGDDNLVATGGEAAATPPLKRSRKDREMQISAVDEESSEDENLQELLDLQRTGVKVLLPKRKRARRNTDEHMSEGAARQGQTSSSSSMPPSSGVGATPPGTTATSSEMLSLAAGRVIAFN